MSQKAGDDVPPKVDQLDFEFVLFASEVIDYDYIMKLVSDYTKDIPSKREMSRKKLIGVIASDSKFVDHKDLEAYINSLEAGVALSEEEIRNGYEKFKSEKNSRELNAIAEKNGIEAEALQGFVDEIMRRYIFNDGDLTKLLKPLGLGWKARTQKKLELMDELSPLLRRMADGHEVSGLGVYDE